LGLFTEPQTQPDIPLFPTLRGRRRPVDVAESEIGPSGVAFPSLFFQTEALQSLQVRREEENRKKLLGDRKKRDGPDDEMQARLRMELEHSISISIDLT
jgi:hypothetical protein